MHVLETFVFEIVKASKEYMKKEAVRAKIESMISTLVSSGQIKSDKELDDFFASAEMALNALKMVPFSVWKIKGE
jgi:predicted helicase